MEAQIDIAAEDDPAIGAQAFDHRLAQGADPGDRRDADRQAGEEDPKAAEAGAQLTPGETPGEAEIVHPPAAVAASPAMRPSARRTMRPQRSASSG